MVIVIGVFEARVAFPPLKVTLKSEISIHVGVVHPAIEKISSSNERSIFRLSPEILVPVTLENCARQLIPITKKRSGINLKKIVVIGFMFT